MPAGAALRASSRRAHGRPGGWMDGRTDGRMDRCWADGGRSEGPAFACCRGAALGPRPWMRAVPADRTLGRSNDDAGVIV
eukprot:scaffold4735_cov403-Prasinococcus_capsulatus_cf.AAC.12